MRRLLDVEIRFRHGVATTELAEERDMLLTALNKVEIQLGFDCSTESTSEDLSDSIDLFRESSETSCCRLVDHSSRFPKEEVRAEVLPSRFEEPEEPEVKPLPASNPANPQGVFGRFFGGAKK